MSLGKKNDTDLPKPLPGFEHIKRFWDPRLSIVTAKILPGECYVSRQGELVSTVLGSCVSACIRDRDLGVGGMNHFMLPEQHDVVGLRRDNLVNASLCYGNWAMEYLINSILKCGGRRSHLEVKVFGGGKVLKNMNHMDIGKRNVDFVMNYLERDGLKVVSCDLGGDYPRKVLYYSNTGAVKMRKLVSVANQTVEKREIEYLKNVSKKPDSGDIELF